MTKLTSHWLKGLVAAVIGGASNSVIAIYVDPAKFNLTPSGLLALGQLALGGAILSVFMYLKQSPVPPDEDAKA